MLARHSLSMIYPTKHGLASLLGYLEMNEPLRLLLHNDATMKDASTLCDILYSKTHQVTTAELTVDHEVEKRQIS